jgi:hypothetical protein
VATWDEETGRDFFRLLSTISQFRRRFGRWPSILRAESLYLHGMEHHYMKPYALQCLKEKLTLIAEDDLGDILAEDGADRYSYANNPISQEPAHDASIWLWGIRM